MLFLIFYDLPTMKNHYSLNLICVLFTRETLQWYFSSINEAMFFFVFYLIYISVYILYYDIKFCTIFYDP